MSIDMNLLVFTIICFLHMLCVFKETFVIACCRFPCVAYDLQQIWWLEVCVEKIDF